MTLKVSLSLSVSSSVCVYTYRLGIYMSVWPDLNNEFEGDNEAGEEVGIEVFGWGMKIMEIMYYGYRDEDRDWEADENIDGGSESDSGSLINEENVNENKDDGLSDYQSGDEVGN
ncbi:hypothetical protein Acr_15g0004790 [Actinidia rufa]|uniref:Uncharacterized protein n=1 Tax=Actinidia rufa TaxID=165716 RepID=A0A7J0FUM4_9ERIC|nr:hypothetical protein Acr_15g0004790 [Actinidia rufa]